MTKLPGSSRTIVLVLRTKAFAETILEHCSQTMFTKTVRILRTGVRNVPIYVCVWEELATYPHGETSYVPDDWLTSLLLRREAVQLGRGLAGGREGDGHFFTYSLSLGQTDTVNDRKIVWLVSCLDDAGN